MLGVERILSASAVGSLKEEYKPLDIVVPDQFFDRTKGRISTFFGRGLVAHVAFAHPFCGTLSTIAADSAEAVGATVHRGGTYVNMEGPQFSTLAESRLYRSWGMDVIGMTNLQEAKLAREAEICYATLALVTDYDCWHPGPRLGDRGPHHREPDAERGRRRSRRSPRRSGGSPRRGRASARPRSRRRSSPGRSTSLNRQKGIWRRLSGNI